jgi:hypothetical protein
LCPLPYTSDIGNIGACLHPRCILGSGKPGARVATAALTSSSASISPTTALMRHRLRLHCLLFCATIFGAPRAPATSYAATLTSASSTAVVRMISSTTAIRPHARSTSTIGTKGYCLLEQPCGFPLQPQHLQRTDHCDCWGMSARRLLSSLTVCDAPAVTAGGC